MGEGRTRGKANAGVAMQRLLIHVEGKTEETFVNEVLAAHLREIGYEAVRARRMGLSQHRGGIRPWQSALRDFLRHVKEDPGAIHTTMVDFYGLPHDWPGRKQAPSKGSSSARAEFVEEAVLAEVVKEMGPRFDARRFVPFVAMHEFEALLFSDPVLFAQGIKRDDLAAEFFAVRQKFESPEDINDSAETAPSKRILKVFHSYDKPFHGPLQARSEER